MTTITITRPSDDGLILQTWTFVLTVEGYGELRQRPEAALTQYRKASRASKRHRTMSPIISVTYGEQSRSGVRIARWWNTERAWHQGHLDLRGCPEAEAPADPPQDVIDEVAARMVPVIRVSGR